MNMQFTQPNLMYGLDQNVWSDNRQRTDAIKYVTVFLSTASTKLAGHKYATQNQF